MAHTRDHRRAQRRRDPFRDVPRAQELTREGIVASGELLRPEILSRIGDALGGLNQIGALRSGGAEVALQDISREFTDRFGQIATAATTGAVGAGLQATRIRLDRKEQNRRRKAALLSSIGSVVGAGVGFATAGPPGAVAGAQVG